MRSTSSDISINPSDHQIHPHATEENARIIHKTAEDAAGPREVVVGGSWRDLPLSTKIAIQ